MCETISLKCKNTAKHTMSHYTHRVCLSAGNYIHNVAMPLQQGHMMVYMDSNSDNNEEPPFFVKYTPTATSNSREVRVCNRIPTPNANPRSILIEEIEFHVE